MSLSSVLSAPACLNPARSQSNLALAHHPPSTTNGYSQKPAKPTRTSLLRMKSRSAGYVELDYSDLARRKKKFGTYILTLSSILMKSFLLLFSIQHNDVGHSQPLQSRMPLVHITQCFCVLKLYVCCVLCRSTRLPEGETLHSFITGARYNRYQHDLCKLTIALRLFSTVSRAHHMDSRSLERLGLYIPRGDPSRAFVNPAGIAPPPPSIYGQISLLPFHVKVNQCPFLHLSGTKRYSRDHQTEGSLTSRRVLSDLGIYGYRPTSGVSEGGGSSRMERELEQVFGPDHGGASLDSESMLAYCEEGDSMSSSVSVGVEVGQEHPATEEDAMEVKGEVPLSPQEGNETLPSSARDIASVHLELHEVADQPEKAAPISLGELPTWAVEEAAELGEGHSDVAGSLHDRLSPAAQRLTDEILMEYQASLSSSEGSGGFPFGNETIPLTDSHLGTDTAVNLRDTSTSPTLQDLHPQQTKSTDIEDCSESHTSLHPPTGSSTLFIDVTVPSAPSDNGSDTTTAH